MSIATLLGNLRAAFRERLLTLNGLPNGRAWEGAEDFHPVAGEPYVSEAFHSVSQRMIAVANPGAGKTTVQHSLLGAATFFYPANQGTAEIEAIAGACAQLFHPGRKLSRGGDSATIVNTQIGGLYRDGANLGLAVTVTLQAFTQN